MNAYYQLSFVLFAAMTFGGVFSETAQPNDIHQRETLAGDPSVSTSPTPTPCDPNMQKIKPNSTPQPSGAPVSAQASGSGESIAVRDIPTPKPQQPQTETREINPLNRQPIKTINPCVTTTADGALSHPPAQKKKPSRHKKRH